MLLLTDKYVGGNLEFENEQGSLGPLQNFLAIERIAQWAVNVVDARDPDAIMTPFEYDLNPWDGWDVDGRIETADGVLATPAVPGGTRGIVWGSEGTHLVLSEALALHDRRVEDLAPGQTREDGDNDMDQVRRPEGSLFLELFNPAGYPPTVNAGGNIDAAPFEMPPMELYGRDATGRHYVDLTRVSPAAADGVTYPVWQVVVVFHDGIYNSRIATQNPPTSQSALVRQTMEMDQLRFDPAEDDQQIERVIWFANVNPQATDPTDVLHPRPLRNITYWNRLGAAYQLEPGQYGVVGPRQVTTIGAIREGDPTMVTPSPQRIELIPGPGGVSVYDFAGNNVTNTIFATGTIRPPVAMHAEMLDPDPDGIAMPRWIGLNVSEPVPMNADLTASNPNYYDRTYDSANGDTYPMALDTPQDGVNTPLGGNDVTNTASNMLQSQLHGNVRTAYLQRLADPTLPFNPINAGNGLPPNPYITVDWHPIDLTVFNGEENTNQQVNTDGDGMPDAPLDPSDPMPMLDNIESRQRGELSGTAMVDYLRPIFTNPLRANMQDPVAGALAMPPVIQYRISSTLGFLTAYQPFDATGPGLTDDPTTRYRFNNIGMQGFPVSNPTPWTPWPNRPFASPMEVLVVSSSSPSRTLFERRVLPGNEYDSSGGAGTFRAPFNHMLNFFHTTVATAPPVQGGNLFRLFDYVETPSRFSGSFRWIDPQFAASNSAFPGEPDLAVTYRPPFNRISAYRDPGRVNMNTLAHPVVWNSVAGDFADVLTWGTFNASRRNYNAGAEILPTAFANPFRPAASADLMPNVPSFNIGPGGGFGTAVYRPTREIDATLMRTSGTVASPSDTPLFGNYTGSSQATGTNTHPYFRYQGLMRLPNMVTTNSNVYAVWMTIGYFEAVPTTVSPSHPDGYALGAELGADSGQITRRRVFTIIDRSIPVAYQPGQNHNVERTIRLQRFIE